MANLQELISKCDLSKVNLHTHTTRSDGECSPYEMFYEANKQGLELLAITDHNRLPKSEDYQRWSLNPEFKFEYVPGIEVSSVDKEVGKVHILGYFIDPIQNLYHTLNKDKYQNFEKFVLKIRKGMATRVGIAVNNFNDYVAKNYPDEFNLRGPITLDEVIEAASKIKGAPKENIELEPIHLAFPLMEKGYIKNTIQAKKFVDKYNILPDYKSNRWYKPSPDQVIKELKKLGATDIVIAHPGISIKDDNIIPIHDLVKRLANKGLTGIEVVCRANEGWYQPFFSQMSRLFNLTQTIGYDNHLKKDVLAIESGKYSLTGLRN